MTEEEERTMLDAYEQALAASVKFETQPLLFHVFAYIGLAFLRLRLDPTLEQRSRRR